MSNHASNSHLSQTIHSAGHLFHALLHAAVLSVDSCSLREMLRKAKQCAWCQTTETTYLRRMKHHGRACPICSYMSHLSITGIMPCLGACLTCKSWSRWKVIYHRCPPSGEGKHPLWYEAMPRLWEKMLKEDHDNRVEQRGMVKKNYQDINLNLRKTNIEPQGRMRRMVLGSRISKGKLTWR